MKAVVYEGDKIYSRFLVYGLDELPKAFSLLPDDLKWTKIEIEP